TGYVVRSGYRNARNIDAFTCSGPVALCDMPWRSRTSRKGQRMERPNWAPEGVDMERPSAARLYDYALGGSHNFAVDRELCRQLIATVPDLVAQAHASRGFLRRAVRFCVAAGISQFLDIGSGIPTRGNVHEIAPEARVMYVDTDPVAIAHSR